MSTISTSKDFYLMAYISLLSFYQNLFKYAVLHMKKGLLITDLGRNQVQQTLFDTVKFCTSISTALSAAPQI